MSSKFDEIIDRRNTHSAKYMESRFEEDPQLISMWVADMDFKVMDEIQEAINKRVEHGIFGYSRIYDDYYNAVIDWMKRRHDFEVEKEWIIPFPGIVPALRVCVQAYTKPEDEVVILKPVYYPFDMVVEEAGRKLRKVSLLEDHGKYEIDFEKLEEALSNPNVKMMILCSPHNPIGKAWTKEELRKIGELSLKYEITLISDEIHMDFNFTDQGHVAMYEACPETRKNTVICTAPSKTFNLAGLNVSNIIIADKELREKFEKQMTVNGVSVPDILALEACKAAYLYGDEWVDELKEYLKANYQFMKDWFAEHMPMITLSDQEALYLVWADFRALGLDEKELEKFMLEDVHLWLDEGYIFGEEGAGFERFNIACPRPILEEALERIEKAAKKRGLIE